MKYKIYQIKKDCEARKYLFMSLEYMRFNGYQPRLEDYTLVYEDTLAEGKTSIIFIQDLTWEETLMISKDIVSQ